MYQLKLLKTLSNYSVAQPDMEITLDHTDKCGDIRRSFISEVLEIHKTKDKPGSRKRIKRALRPNRTCFLVNCLFEFEYS